MRSAEQSSILRPALRGFRPRRWPATALLHGFAAVLAASLAPTGAAAQAWLEADTLPDHPSELSNDTADTLRFTAREGSWMSVDVAPDGRAVVFDLLGDLYRVPIEGGEARRLTHGTPWDAQPRFSPDGERVLFVSDRSGSKNVWTLDLASGRLEAITSEPQSSFLSPDWIDDEYIVVSKGTRLGTQRLWMMHVDGGRGQKLFGEDNATPPNQPPHVTGPAPSADGRRIWYAQRPGRWHYNAAFPQMQIGSFDRETGSVRMETFRYGSGFRPTLSPDGRWLAYGTRHEEDTALRLRDLTTGEERWLAHPVQHDELESANELDVLPGMDFTPDSREVVASYGGRLWRIPVDGGDPTEIPFRASVEVPLAPTTRASFVVDDAPDFTAGEIRDLAPAPDGERLAFVAVGRLWVVDDEEGEARPLTPDSLSVAWPTWSPDGTRLAFAFWSGQAGGGDAAPAGPGGRGGIGAISADGGDVEILTGRPGFYAMPAWAPDGRRIVALRGPERVFRETAGPGGAGQTRDLVWIASSGDAEGDVAPAAGRAWPHFVDGSDRIHLHHPARGVVSIRWDGTDERAILRVRGPATVASNGQPVSASRIVLAPTGRRALAIVHDQLWSVDVPVVGGPTPTVDVEAPAFPAERLSELGAQFPAWGADGRSVHWGLGNAHFRYDLDDARAFADSVAAVEAERAANPSASDAATDPAGDPPGDTGAAAPDDAAADVDEDEDEPRYRPEERRIRAALNRDAPDGAVVLSGARVVTMRGDEILEAADVLVRGHRIAAVGPAGTLRVPADATVMDVAGHVIVPGFVDTHAHLNGTFGLHRPGVWAYEANLAYGVTTVRDPQTGTTDVLSYRDQVEEGRILGPRVYSTGPGVFGSYVVERIRSAEHARDVLERYARYFDTKTIKMYMAGTRQERQWIARAARDVGLMPTTEAGLRWQQDLTMMVDGYAGQEHNLPVFPIYDDVVRLAARTGISYTPTLLVTYGGPWAENYWYTTEEVWNDPKLRRFVPRADLDPKVRRRVRPVASAGAAQGWFLEEEYTFQEHARFVTDLLAAGGRAGIGSHGQLQGLGYHWELWSVQSGGLTPHDALRVATLQGAEAIGLAGDLGSIEVGKLADLVVLRDDPLEDIRNSTSIRYVMKNGRLYDGESLDEVWPRIRAFTPSWTGEGVPDTRAGVGR